MLHLRERHPQLKIELVLNDRIVDPVTEGVDISLRLGDCGRGNFIARRLGYRIATVPVHWEHVRGSKVRPVQDAALMFIDVVRVRINALRGLYDPQRGNMPSS